MASAMSRITDLDTTYGVLPHMFVQLYSTKSVRVEAIYSIHFPLECNFQSETYRISKQLLKSKWDHQRTIWSSVFEL